MGWVHNKVSARRELSSIYLGGVGTDEKRSICLLVSMGARGIRVSKELCSQERAGLCALVPC